MAAADVGERLVRFDRWWTKVESALCRWVLITEIGALGIWISLNGLAKEYAPGQSAAPLVFRSIVSAVVLGLVANRATKAQSEKMRGAVVTAAVVVGLLAGRLWTHALVGYSSNVLNWLQNASALMLVGGLRGLVTRLTLWLALLGASIATSKGKHINIDVVMRATPPKLRVPVAIVGWVAAAIMCFAAAWGFFDYIAIESFNTPKEATTGEKVSHVKHEMGADLFLLRRQLSLDISTLGTVISGKSYERSMTAREWNDWIDGSSGWREYWSEDAVRAQKVPDSVNPDAPKSPAVNVPGGAENARGLLIRDLNFVFVFGLAMIGLRFLLRITLVLLGKLTVDPDAAHQEEDQELRHEAAP